MFEKNCHTSYVSYLHEVKDKVYSYFVLFKYIYDIRS